MKISSHCCFNMHFPDELSRGASFNVLISLLVSSIHKVSIEVFRPFFNWVVCFLVVEF